MQGFAARMVSAILVVLLLAGYNFVITKKENETAQIEAYEKKVEAALAAASMSSSDADGSSASGNLSNDGALGKYADGIYTGSAQGFGGEIEVEVVVLSGAIDTVNIVSAEKEDGAYLTMAEDIIPTIVEANSADVDTISGATFSSTGIKNAVQQALDEAVSN